jgi:uncharacterized protein RhaS with RHS repeats
LDATRLYHFGARYYDPAIGQWTQHDPSGQDANAYAYADGDPINRVDPSGRDFFDDAASYAAGIATGVAVFAATDSPETAFAAGSCVQAGSQVAPDGGDLADSAVACVISGELAFQGLTPGGPPA